MDTENETVEIFVESLEESAENYFGFKRVAEAYVENIYNQGAIWVN